MDRKCSLSDSKDDCSNSECRYVHCGCVQPRAINDPLWVTLPGKLTGYRQGGFRLNKPLGDLSEAGSYERFSLLRPLQVKALMDAYDAAFAGLPLASLRHDCSCTSVQLQYRVVEEEVVEEEDVVEKEFGPHPTESSATP